MCDVCDVCDAPHIKHKVDYMTRSVMRYNLFFKRHSPS
ncbi:DNA-binding domain protein [Burkholderia thailandensis]|nr:DNA-binding domain protein [Burkholderia thailandensis]